MLLHFREPHLADDLVRWSGDIDRLFRSVWATRPAPRRRNFAFEVAPDDNGVTIRANVPGLDASAINVTVEGRTLTISGSRKPEQRQNGAWWVRERSFGDFSHRFHLADDLDADAVAASCRNGVLTVRIPKRPEAQPRQIPITVR